MNLWVFGSFARGAILCGDLDIIVEIQAISGSLPYESRLRKAIVGGFKDISFFVGTPERNSSHVSISDAVLIWSIDSPCYENNILSIKEDPNACRYDRITDKLPGDHRQVKGLFPDVAAELLKLFDAEILISEWYSLDELQAKKVTLPKLHQDRLDQHQSFCGKKTAEMLPYVYQVLSEEKNSDQWYDGLTSTQFHLSGLKVFVGRYPFDLTEIYRGAKGVVYAPHKNNRVENGIWVIRRGRFFSPGELRNLFEVQGISP